jgi:hypothetical protein
MARRKVGWAAGLAVGKSSAAARGTILGLVICAYGLLLAGCDDQLPGFANPGPYDAGQDADAAADDDDAG